LNWHVFEQDKPFVTDSLRQGHFDYMEVLGAVEETEFFRMLLDEGILQRLAATYPTPRQKEEVPLWLYLASEVTLRLHGASGFAAYPYILHCGGLIDALSPSQVQPKLDAASGQWRPTFEGYNKKNHYARVSPCDQDFLRKMSKDTSAEALEAWFGTSVVRTYRELDAFDAEGIFLVDGTYIFVPLDNERYEGSSILRFDEHGHPMSKDSYDALPPKRQRRCPLRRCYRAVKLTHTNAAKDYSLRCGTKVLPGKASEVRWVRPLVERFVDTLGSGVMKLLVYDRGLVDGPTVSRLKRLGVDSLFPLKKGMDVWKDARVLAEHDGRPWQRYVLPKPTPPPPPQDRPEPVARREAKRQRTLKRRRKEQAPSEPTRTLESIDYHWIEPSRVWESCTVPVSVLLIKNHYANGEELDWALASTREFADPLDMWHTYGLRPSVEEDHRQDKCFWDMTHFRSTAFSHVVNQIIFVELAASLIQIFLRKIGRDELARRTRQRLLDALLPNRNKIVLHYQQHFGTYDPYEYQELLLTLREGARRKVLGKTRRLRRAQLVPPDLLWRPE